MKYMNNEERKARNREYNRIYRERHRERVQQSQRRWYLANMDRAHQWTKENPNKVRKIKQNYKKRHRNRLIFQDILRNRIIAALRSKGVRKSRKTTELVGCSVKDLKSYLESKFLNIPHQISLLFIKD